VKLFLDTNIILDLLTGRLPFKAEAERLFSLADQGKVKLYASSQSVATADYVLNKTLKAEVTRSSLQKLLTIISVCDLSHKAIVRAVNDLNFSDIEDSLQHQCAIQSKASILVTRNEKDFRKASISVMTPKQVLAVLGERKA
jgi:predicted nucleic acid-binding protein